MTKGYCPKCGHEITKHYAVAIPNVPKGCHVRNCECVKVYVKGK